MAAMWHRAEAAVTAASAEAPARVVAAMPAGVVVERRSGVAAVAVAVESSRTKPRPCRLH